MKLVLAPQTCIQLISTKLGPISCAFFAFQIGHLNSILRDTCPWPYSPRKFNIKLEKRIRICHGGHHTSWMIVAYAENM